MYRSSSVSLEVRGGNLALTSFSNGVLGFFDGLETFSVEMGALITTVFAGLGFGSSLGFLCLEES